MARDQDLWRDAPDPEHPVRAIDAGGHEDPTWTTVAEASRRLAGYRTDTPEAIAEILRAGVQLRTPFTFYVITNDPEGGQA